MLTDAEIDMQRRRSHAENALKARMQHAAHATADADIKTPVVDEPRLAFSRDRMRLLNAMDPAGSAYNINSAVRLHGHIDIDALHAATIDLVKRHAVLRVLAPPVQSSITTAGESAELRGRARLPICFRSNYR